MNKNVVWQTVVLMFCFVWALFALCDDVEAAGKCGGIDQSTNDSLFDACKWSKEISKPRGAMWISSNSSSTSVSSKVKVDDWESGDGKVNVYLHGAIINGGGAKATYIKLVKGSSTINGTAASYSAYSPLDNVPDSMDRHGNTAPFSNNITSSVVTIKLNVKKLVDLETKDSTSGDYWIYKVPIQAFRCYDGYTPSVGEGGCYSSKSTLRVEVNMKRTLKAKGKISGDADTVVWDNLGSKEVWRGSSASVTVDENKTKDGKPYVFSHWGSSCQPGGVTSYNPTNSGRKCTVNPLNKDIDVYAYYKLETHTLKAKGKISGDADTIVWDNLGTKTVEAGSSASVTVDENKTKDGKPYVFSHWGSSCQPGGVTSYNPTNSGRKCTVNPLNKDIDVYAYYNVAKRTLSGKAVVDDASCTNLSAYDPGSVKVDWGSPASIAAKDHPNLIFKGWKATGCTGNYISSDRTYSVSQLKDNTTVYAVYEPKPLPCNGTCSSTLDIKQSRNDSGVWTKDVIYTKPNDIVKLEGTFEPGYQQVYNPTEYGYAPDKAKFSYDGGYTNKNGNFSSIVDFYDKRYIINGSSVRWKNAFSIVAGGDTKWCLGSYVGTPGFNDPIVNATQYTTETGTSWAATSSIDRCSLAMGTPWGISFSYDGEYNLRAVVDDGPKDSDEVVSYTPYNFKNSTKIEEPSGEVHVVYAGEEKDIKYSIKVEPRYNDKVGETYATKVPLAKVKLQWRYEGETYNEYNSKTRSFNGGLNKDERMEGEKTPYPYYSEKINMNDLPAGSRVWIRSCVYPANSGDPGNWQDKEGNHEWNCNNEIEYVVAKRPSFQVWGGGVYSAGKVDLKETVSNKKKLAGYSDGTFVFGPWTELGLMASGSVTGLASGAGLGYAQIGDAENMARAARRENRSTEIENPSISNVGGGSSNNYCDRSKLSFSNSGCNGGNGSVGGLDKGGGINKYALVSDFAPGDKTKYNLNSDVFSWNVIHDNNDERRDHHIQDSETEYYYDSASNGSLSVNFQYYNTIIPVKRESNRGIYTSTIVIDSERDVHLMSDIYYDDSSSYTAIEDIPKVIIYSKKDINIECSVQRIDAVLIAEGTINTCYGSESANSKSRSIPLIVNGATISNKLILNRTYGAATGVNSIVPAEIINYDSSLYLWGSKQADATNSGELTEASIRELAPRY